MSIRAWLRLRETHKFAAFAVSMTLPPPTLHASLSKGRSNTVAHIRKEVAAVMLTGPGNSVTPACFGGLGDNAVIDLEGQILLRLQGSNGLRDWDMESCIRNIRLKECTHHLGGR